MRKVINFSAGPSLLPEEVLQQAAEEMLDWRGSGMSVMEMSHRGSQYMEIHAAAQQALRDLLAIPAQYKILFLQGGGTMQFTMVPMNLIGITGKADYVTTGFWSAKALNEARTWGQAVEVASSKASDYDGIPAIEHWHLSPDASYVHVCANETIGGVEFHWDPDTGSVPLVADMSSNILSRPLDVTRYGLIYGGAQKNIGPAGLAFVIVREDLLGHCRAGLPALFDYRTQSEHDSMLNTPPTYPIYIAGLVFEWIKRQGGVAAMARTNAEKSSLLYECIDASGLYHNLVRPDCRSRMNVTFRLTDPALDAAFLAGAEAHGMLQLKGHRSTGGIRASLYNAMPLESVRTLVDYMRDFERRHG